MQTIKLLDFQPRPPFHPSNVQQVDVALEQHFGPPHPRASHNVLPVNSEWDTVTQGNISEYSLSRRPRTGVSRYFAHLWEIFGFKSAEESPPFDDFILGPTTKISQY
jgi:hypothetical protein